MKTYLRPFLGLISGTLALGAVSAFRPASPQRVQANETVSVWLTYGDQSKLLEQQANTSFGPDSGTNPTTITVDENTAYQSIDGFGAAMTGSAAYLMNQKMNASQRDGLMNDLFGSGGVNFSFVRHSIGSSDFSIGDYTYDDVPQGQTDYSLSNFSIAPDLVDVVPMLKAALVKNPNLRILGTPWSPPAWMKNSYTLKGSSLADANYGVYADYFVKYVQAFAAEGVPIYAVTLQNEPFTSTPYYPSSQMFAYQEGNFLKYNIGPAFASAGINTKLIVFDDAWEDLGYTSEALVDGTARQYAAGTAFHCYRGTPDEQNQTHDPFPDKGIWMTECSGTTGSNFGGDLKWTLSNLIIGSTRAWAKGVLMWNMALDQNNGPTNNGCLSCRGLVTIDNNTGNYSRNVEYYAFGHASKFVKQGAVRIASNSFSGGIENVAFKNPDGSKVLVAVNNGSSQTTFKVRWGSQAFSYTLPAGGVGSFVWSGAQSGGSGGGGGLVSGHNYKLTAKHSGLVLDVPGSSYNWGQTLQQWEDNGSNAQQWTLTDAGSGYYTLTNVNSGLVLDVPNSSANDGVTLQQWGSNNSSAQQWSLIDAGGGYYNVVNRNSGKYMDVYGNDNSWGAPVVQYQNSGLDNQKWLLTDLTSASRSASATKALAAKAPAAEDLRLQVYPTVVDKEIKLEYTATQAQTLNFQLVDLTGRVVAKSETAVTQGLNRLTVPISAASQGVYVLKVGTGAGLLTRRVVVAR